eukprot:Phypoly_transcript_00232.p1 GENE.Phypoly_transcript_00232~~Phypoly_transcript_00232.p1  ORF type:complete len:1084 (-),score=135.93 Phypoly_transcript_00232:132-3383(-)
MRSIFCSVLRGPSSLAKYEKAANQFKPLKQNEEDMAEAVLLDPRKFKNTADDFVDSYYEEVKLELSKAIKPPIDAPTPISTNQDTDLSILSIWAKMVQPTELDRLLENLIEVYESNFISEHEYKIRRREIESLLPANHAHRMNAGEKEDRNVLNVVFIKDGVRSSRGVANVQKSSTKQKDNVVRVFLSSTFRDMQAEREQLIKQAFPILRATCAARGLIFKEVDLRWGITEEQATRGDILDICLNEIDLCRPYFVNFVGSRYGWVPTEFPKAVVAKFPFLENITPGTKSVTEIEVMYGALNNTSTATGAFFFIKNESAGNPDEIEAARLAALKRRIRDSGLPCKTYNTAEEFARSVSQALLAAIERDYPRTQKEQEDEQAAATRMHSLHSMQKSRVYVGRQSNFDLLDNFLLSHSSGPFLVTGDRGVGKSSLLSNWYNENKGKETGMIHHVGCGADATDCISMLRRIMAFIKTQYGWVEEISDDPKRIQRDFSRWLQTATQGRRLVLIIDGLDQLEDVDGAHNLVWLPEHIPSHVKVLVSSATGHRCTKVLANRNSQHMVLKGLSPYEKEILSVEYLLAYGKTLSSHQLEMICKEPQTANPLYLRCLLEELRVFGVFEEVDQLVEHYLRARQASQLLEKILHRFEKDYGQEYPGLVRDVFCLVWASHSGVTEQELLEILEVPTLALSSLLSAARELFNFRNGALTLFHDSLRQAVQARYLDHEDLIRKYHLLLAEYFESSTAEISISSKQLSRKAEELPYHLLKSEQWYRLKQCLANIPIFEEWFTKRSRFDIKRFWLVLGKHYSVGDTYVRALAEYEETSGVTLPSLLCTTIRVAKFLKEMLQYNAAAALLDKCLQICDQLPRDDAVKSKILYRIAQIYWNQGMWEKAEPPCLESLRLRQQLFGEHHLLVAKCLCGLGELHVLRDQKKAEGYLQRSLDIRKSILGENHHLVSRIYHDIAVVKDFYGLHDEAISLHQRAIKIREDTLGPENPQLAVSWESLGTTQKLARKPREAEVSMKKALAINRAVHGDIHPSIASGLEWLSLIYEAMRLPVKAAEYHAQSEKVLAELSEMGLGMEERVAD